MPPLPKWVPRRYQEGLWNHLVHEGYKRAIGIWHRRAGKDEVLLRWTAQAAAERIGPYWHMLPEYAQARKAIWDAVNPVTGKRRIDEAFPPRHRTATREADMFIRLKSGSTWQVVGSDNYNSLVGTPPIGIVFSEFALADPNAWAYLSPILAENGGWAVFITTPRGRNHAWRMFEAARREPKKWFAERLAAADTEVFTTESLADARKTLVDLYGSAEVGQSVFEQEYECSFDAAVVGSYYGRAVAEAEREGRIRADVEPIEAPVHTAWDLGVGDATAIWWWQVAGTEIRIVDYYESSGVGLDHYVDIIKGKRWRRGEDYVPQDARVREFASGRTRVETMLALGLQPRVVKAHKIEDGINAARRTLPRCLFHERRCERGLDALRLYHAEWNDERRVLADRPRHDWTSHAADAFRYLALAWEELHGDEPAKPKPDAPILDRWDNPVIFRDAAHEQRIRARIARFGEGARPLTLDELWEEHEAREREMDG